MLPEAKNEDLIYVAIQAVSSRTSYVTVYSYPAGKLVGNLTDFEAPWYECVDKHGSVFIADASAFRVYEYAHGGSAPINSLTVNRAKGCAIDPTTGNLAVMQQNGGSVYIFKKAKGTPTVYANSSIYYLSGITYDSSGDLFVDGSFGIRGARAKRNASSGLALLELPRAGNVFKTLTVNGDLNDSSQDPMQWDGKYLGIGSSGLRKDRPRVGFMLVNRVKLTDGVGSIVRRVPLAMDSHGQHNQFWIYDDVAIQPSNGRNSYFEIFDYPSGKQIKRVILHDVIFPEAIGVTLSLATSHR